MTKEDEIKNQKVKKVYIGVIILLIVMFIALFSLSLNKVLQMEGSFPDKFTKLTDSAVAEPLDCSAGIELLEASVEKAEDNKPKLNEGHSFSIDNISSDGTDEFHATLDYICDSVEDSLEEKFEAKSSDFGASMNDVVLLPDISDADILSEVTLNKGSDDEKTVPGFSCTYKYYVCPSCRETSDEPLENCELCGYSYPYSLKYRDEYTCTMYVDDNEKTKNLFNNLSEEEVRALVSDEINEYVSLDSVSVDYIYYIITFRVDRMESRISYLEYKKVMDVSIKVTCTGDYSSIGSVTIKADVTEKDKYEFTWPGLSLNTHEKVIAPGNSDNLLASLTCDDPKAKVKNEKGKEVDKYIVSWVSSDSDIVAVDDEGYLKANKKAEGKSATITATFEFNGETYSDTCEVFVRNSVESISMSKRSIRLSAGETYQLSAKVSASNSLFSFDKATVTTVGNWASSDESVATVDENGLVTATGEGTATISVYSDDGYYLSTCEVTVK